ncbi:MAG TPA: complex I NDUFA9 subunit family protein, partial [Caulobacteraceae bacterium]|nr:complex I NDUFA9 subunit family protein [Caulobacteraceae bacterium]
LPLPHAAGTLIGMAGNVQGLLMTPVLTTDQALLLRVDNVASPDRPGLQALGVTPTSVEAIVPTYLWRYRKGGQFAEAAA